MSLLTLSAVGGSPLTVTGSLASPTDQLSVGSDVVFNLTFANAGGTATVQPTAVVSGIDPALVQATFSPASSSILSGGTKSFVLTLSALGTIPVGAAITVDIDAVIL